MRSTVALATTTVLAIAATLAFAPLWIAAMLGTGLVAGVLLAWQERRRTPTPQPDAPGLDMLAVEQNDVVLVFQANGHLAQITPSATSTLGLDPNDLDALGLEDIVHDEDRSSVSGASTEATETGTTQVLTIRVRGADRWQRMELRLTPVTTPDGDVMIARLRDITARRALEEAADRHAGGLDLFASVTQQALAGSDDGTLVRAVVTAARQGLIVDGCELYRTSGAAPEMMAGIGPGGIQLDRRSTTLQGSALANASADADAVVYETADRIVTDGVLPPAVQAIAVPISDVDRTDGALIVRSLTPRDFTRPDIAFLQALADLVALARRQRGAEQDAFRRSRHDALTGLVNKNVFLERLANSIAHCGPEGEVVAELLLDLDHFKIINDSLGHEAGDAVIGRVSEILGQALRPGDTLARFGADEFIVLARRLGSADQGVLAAERLLSVLHQPIDVAGHDVQLTASVGVAACSDPDVDPGEMVREADAALYRAKERGRERVEMFEPEMLDAALTRLETEAELREALASGQLRMLYQPVVDLHDGSTSRVEALVRWVHPRRGLVSPDAFIPISESTGLIEEIGAWVIGEVTRQTREWLDAGNRLQVSVNLSPRQLNDPTLLRVIDDALEANGIAASSLAVEVAEDAIARDPVRAIAALRSLSDRGVSVNIDDFGTGFSSITHLRDIPIDSVKIDRALVADIGRSGTDYAVVAAVVQLAKAISGNVVAKGVETESQLELLRDLGCHLAQGFLFSPAVLEVGHGNTDRPVVPFAGAPPS